MLQIEGFDSKETDLTTKGSFDSKETDLTTKGSFDDEERCLIISNGRRSIKRRLGLKRRGEKELI